MTMSNEEFLKAFDRRHPTLQGREERIGERIADLERERDELVKSLRYANDRLIALEQWQHELVAQETADSITIGLTTFYRRKK